MSLFLWTNNASSLLASGINSSVTTLSVTPTQGALFPAPGAGQVFNVTLEDTSGNIEVCTCTGRTSDTLTVVRGAESTTALSFASGSRVEIRITAGMLSALLQKNGGDTMTGTTTVNGVINLASSGSIQGGEFTGPVRSGAGVTAGQITVSGGQPMSGTATILTSSNVQANLPSGTSLALTNMIVLWAGTSLSIPSGWVICDGTNGTPDLRDQFIVGGGGSLPTNGTYSASTATDSGISGTTAGYALTLADMISHVHPFDYFFGNSAAPIGIPGFSAPANGITGLGTAGTRNSFAGSPNTGAGTNAHTHTIPDLPHTHPQAIPYRAVFAIMKT
jgi:hypothetical protein